jgi:hypothetical protein
MSEFQVGVGSGEECAKFWGPEILVVSRHHILSPQLYTTRTPRISKSSDLQ